MKNLKVRYMDKLSDDVRKLKEIFQTGKFNLILNKLSEEEDYRDDVLNYFETDTLINELGNRGDLDEACSAYLKQSKVDFNEYIMNSLSKTMQIKFFAHFFDIPHLSPAEEFGTAIINFVNNKP